jgi:hypothetical protein
MATTTPNFGFDIPQSTDLVKDGATAIAALGTDIDTAFVDLKGGTTGQVLAKASGSDLDFSWVAQDDSNAIQNAIVDAKGDLISATANDTPARLAVGTNGHVLTADSAEATGLKWAAPAGGGKVLQVVQGTTTTLVTSTSSTYADTTLTATITPSSATSKILVLVAQNGIEKTNGDSGNSIGLRLVRGSTTIQQIARFGFLTNTTMRFIGALSTNLLDSPATTSATTYKTTFNNETGGASSVSVQLESATSTIILMEIGA